LVLTRLLMGLGLILLLVFSGVVNFGSMPARAGGPEQPVENVSLTEENNKVLLNVAEKAWLD